jgi:hypothetical protein
MRRGDKRHNIGLGAALALGLYWAPARLRAETAIPLESCRDAEAKWTVYYAIPVALRRPEDVPKTAKCWDFEQGALADSYFGVWTHINATSTGPLPTSSGNAFQNQPTYGDNVSTERAHPSGSLRAGLDSIGGNYWNAPRPIGHQGSWWIGTYEKRPTPAHAWDGAQGDGPVGTLASPAFRIDRNYIHFLMGAWCGNLTQMGAVFNSAEAFIKVWEKSCSKAEPGVIGCLAE